MKKITMSKVFQEYLVEDAHLIKSIGEEMPLKRPELKMIALMMIFQEQRESSITVVIFGIITDH